MAESHQMTSQQQQPPPVPQPHQGGAPAWYPAPHFQYQLPPHQLHQQQQQQQHNVHWPSAPPPDQHVHYPQPQPYQQADFYSQAQQYPVQPPPLPGPPPQFTYMYSQQDQVWPTNTGWGYQQWACPDQHAGFAPEEDWAARARAWAAAKAAMEVTPQAPQSSSVAHQAYQDYQQQELQMLHSSDGPSYPLNPPGQETTVVMNEDVVNHCQKHPSKGLDQSVQTVIVEHTSDKPEQKAASSVPQTQPSNPQVIPRSYLQDVSSSYGQDNSTAAPPGLEKQDSAQQSSTPAIGQQQLRLVHQSQVPAHPEQQPFCYTEPLPSSTYEFHPPQQLEFQQHVLPNYHQQQQYRPPVPSVTMEGLEAEFGITTTSVQNWPSIGGPGLPFAPVMGAGISGSPQFEHPPSLHPHQIPGPQPPMFGRPHGPQPGVSFPAAGAGLGGPFGIGANQSLGPGLGGPMLIPDGNGNLGFPERPKKAAVPSWLREELMKKRAAGLTGGSAGMPPTEDSVQMNGGDATNHLIPRHISSDRVRSSSPGLSDNDEDDTQDEIEAARNAAINQEIKRVLTEVLLKVTGDLFDEIAQEVLDEDDESIYPGKKSLENVQDRGANSFLASSSPPAPSPTPTSARVLIPSLKGHLTDNNEDNESASSGAVMGNVLGLANYASDDEDIETSKESQKAEQIHEDHGDQKDGTLDQNRIERESVDKVGMVKLRAGKRGKQELDNQRGKEKEEDESKEIQPGEGEERKFEMEKGKSERGKNGSREKIELIPEPSQSFGREHVEDAQNLVEREKTRGLIVEEQNHTSGKDASERPSQLAAANKVETERIRSRENVSQSDVFERDRRYKVEGKCEDKNEVNELLLRKEEVANFNNLSKGVGETSSKRERKVRETVDSRKIQSNPSSVKDRKRDEKAKDGGRGRVDEALLSAKVVDERERESNREKRKERLKEKGREREKEQERDRRRSERERKGRERRREVEYSRTRHRSSSISSRGWSASRSNSSSSPDSGRVQRGRRPNKRHSSSPSPGRLKKRRVSRSRSGSRPHSPHAKHNRRKSPSPFRDKSRYKDSRSRSPVRRRRRS